jgi:hypothetical protein
MAVPLQGSEFRIFRSLLEEWPFNSVEEIRIELTQGPVLSYDEVEEALGALARKGYVEEFEPDRWKVTLDGHAVQRTLLGQLAAAS